MEDYNGKKRPYRANFSRSFMPKERRYQKQFSYKLPTTLPSRSLSMDELVKMSGEDPDYLILNVIKEMKVFLSMLEDEAIELKMMARILLIFGKASTSRLHSEVNSMISSLSNCKMFYSIHLPQYLASFHQLGSSNDDSESLEMLTELLIKFHHCMPCTAMETTSVLFPLLENTVKMFLTQNKHLSSLLEIIVEANIKNQEFQKSIKPKEVRYKTAKERLQLQKPPENYRTISILPTPEDIHRPCSFLRPNLTKGEYMDAEHYLDVQFRLLREDYIKPLRDGISEYLQLKEKNEPFTRVQDATIHFKVHITRIEFNDENIIHTAFFDDGNFADINWKQNKRFINGSLLCFTYDDFNTFFLATVIERKIEELSKGILLLEFDNPTDEVLSFHPSRTFVVVETSAYFEAYKHNLTVLSLLNEKKLPMKPYIIKAQKNGDMPAYIRDNDCFDIRPLFGDFKSSESYSRNSKALEETHVKFKNIHILDDENWPKCSDLNLDSFQYAALKAALTKEFCVIQGPPGTGKTFIGLKIVEILLANKLKWQSDENPSPILVVCYTNHALDQFLEGLLEFTRNIVRIGGSCSNNEIDCFNLKRLRKRHEYFGEKMEIIQELKNQIEDQEHLIETSDCQILDENNLRNHMDFRHSKSFMNRRQFEKDGNIMLKWLARDNTEWKIVGKQFQTSIEDILDRTEALSEKEGRNVFNLWKIPLILRWRLYKMWLNKYLIERREILFRSKAQIKKEKEELREMEMQRDVHLCRKSNIIGMTTTGAAKNRDLLQQVNPKIVVVEEAAEILESHIITSLSPGTEHVILIGDHQQLRPNSTAYSLAVNYDLNISLFERMIKNGIEYNRLNLQHRMRPEIASLLVPLFYEDLKNHESVEKFENIKGVAKNMFFMTHVHHEASDDSKTRMNLFEAKFIVALFRYLLLQGYNSSQITILTTYIGQMFAIKRELGKERNNMHKGEEKIKKSGRITKENKEDSEDVKVTVVDNYQGEENDIILLSLVRSNVEGSIGFLKISNRVCVALSRAKKGFFAVGNFEFLANESDLWKNITEKLKVQDAIGPYIQLKCQNHPDTSEVVKEDNDFNSVSEGGCTRDCEFRLDCGHQCALKCHPYDKDHIDIVCYKPCNKRCIRGHLCSRKCYQDCEDCFFMVDKVVDLCGHETKVFCHRKDKDAVCPELCPNFFKCLYNESKVKGVLDNVFFVSCTLKDESMFCFVERFKEYLLLQEYKKSEVHILSQSDPKSLIKAKCKGLVLAVFKDFPDKNKFLVTSTEILIALSSVKDGLYCIGDFDLFAEKYDLWKNVVSALNLKGKIGPALRLQCQNHPETHEVICKEQDFYSVNEGGCNKQCEFNLQCGHTCSLKCHPYDMEHKEVECLKPCLKKCVFDHICTKSCNEVCKCTKRVDKKIESCGHIEKVMCHLQNEPVQCSKMCDRFLSCGHKCPKLCRESCKIDKCNEMVTVKLPVCHHDYPVLCWMQSALTYFCTLCEEPCQTVLSCGHKCKGTCGSCHQGRLHIPCKRPCQRSLICGHKCPSRCFETCPPCESPCRRRCKHGGCRKKCGEPCDPCTRQCEWKCPHKKCNNLCSEKCDRTPCDEPCSVKLKCGHQCIGLCGEPCPRKCRICDKGLLKNACHGIDLASARFVSLENCCHFFEVSELTEWMIQYTGDKAIQGKKCPRCNKDILNNFRFGNVLKSYFEVIETVKKITSGDRTHNRQLKINIMMSSRQIKMSKLRKEFTDQCLNKRSIQELNVMEIFVSICLNFECIFSDSTNIYDFKIKQESKIFDSALNLDLCNKLQVYIDESRKWMTNFILANSFRASKEQLEEFTWEAYRVALADKLIKTLNSIPKLTLDASQLLNELMNSLLTTIPFRGENAKRLHSTYEKFLILSSAPESEKLKIPALKSVSSSKGTWFSCHKGHVVSSITCLDTSEVKSCYECDPSNSIVPTFKGDLQEVRKYLMPDTVNRFRHRVQRASSSVL